MFATRPYASEHPNTDSAFATSSSGFMNSSVERNGGRLDAAPTDALGSSILSIFREVTATPGSATLPPLEDQHRTRAAADKASLQIPLDAGSSRSSRLGPSSRRVRGEGQAHGFTRCDLAISGHMHFTLSTSVNRPEATINYAVTLKSDQMSTTSTIYIMPFILCHLYYAVYIIQSSLYQYKANPRRTGRGFYNPSAGSNRKQPHRELNVYLPRYVSITCWDSDTTESKASFGLACPSIAVVTADPRYSSHTSSYHGAA